MFDLKTFAQLGALPANRLLLDTLSDDQRRADLYRQLRQARQVLRFTSTADAGTPGAPLYRQPVVLLAAREHIDLAFSDAIHFSNSPYRPLGSGTFSRVADYQRLARQCQAGTCLDRK